MANEKGVWRTIGGRRVFIKEGQDLASAMRESGKFKRLKDIEHQQRKINNELAGLTGKDKEIADEEYDAYEQLKKTEKAVSDYENGAIDREELLKRFDGNEDKMKEAFEKMGYTAPTKENIDRANENARKRAEERKNKENQYGYSKEEWDKFQKMPMTDYERENFHNENDLKKYQEIKKDTLEYYTEDFGWEGKTPEEAFIEQMEAVKDYKTTTPYEMGKRLAEGGDYLVANDDMEKFLEERGINPTRKGDVFSTYTDYMGQVQAEMYNEFKSGKDSKEIRQNKPIEPVEDRLKNNMIVSHYGNHVAYRDKDNNLIVTGRENYNDYVNGKKDRLGGEFVTNDNDALKTMIGYEGLDKYPYEGATRDEKTGNDKKWKDFVDSEYNRLKDRVIDTTNAREERAKTNENYRDNMSKEILAELKKERDERPNRIFNAERDLKIGDTYIDGSGNLNVVVDRPSNEGNMAQRKLTKLFVPGQKDIKGTRWEVKKIRSASKEDYDKYPSVGNYGNYEKNKREDWVRKAFDEYKKKHPNSRLNFSNFKDNNKS